MTRDVFHSWNSGRTLTSPTREDEIFRSLFYLFAEALFVEMFSEIPGMGRFEMDNLGRNRFRLTPMILLQNSNRLCTIYFLRNYHNFMPFPLNIIVEGEIS